MLSSLFEEEPGTDPQPGAGGTSRPAIPRPPCSRNATGLCGLSNLGATCYMNALLQTLHYTPEFREALFGISEQELGLGTKLVREIPVRLQELFAKLLLLDQDSVGVEELVNSFGWNNNEASQQHDVQELNRILFDAIESSLVGTARENLTSELFHGVSVQQITCQVCNHVSGREEHFLDIQVALSGKSGLEESMAGIFVDTELLEGSNRYQCDQCQCLVDAKRGCRIRKLPPILTFALLRFLYDLKKGERYKDTSRFQFPMCLDMSPYVEREEQDTLYDLFSVVIHSGSTHSGHYTAYIRDIDCLGTWADPGVEPVKLQPPARQSSTLSSDPIEFSSPTDLLVALLYQLDGQANLNKLCKKIQDQTGTSWNKRFKRQYGPMLKFIKDNPEFTVDESNIIRLAHSQADMSANKSSPVTDSSAAATCTQVEESSRAEGEDTAGVLDRVQKEGEILDSKNPIESTIPVPGECWYCFNDAQVTCIHASEMKSIFQGKTSAYMLFYRRRSLQRPKEGEIQLGSPSDGFEVLTDHDSLPEQIREVSTAFMLRVPHRSGGGFPLMADTVEGKREWTRALCSAISGVNGDEVSDLDSSQSRTSSSSSSSSSSSCASSL